MGEGIGSIIGISSIHRSGKSYISRISLSTGSSVESSCMSSVPHWVRMNNADCGSDLCWLNGALERVHCCQLISLIAVFHQLGEGATPEQLIMNGYNFKPTAVGKNIILAF